MIENLDDKEIHLVLYLLNLGLVNYRVSVHSDKVKLAGALFLAAKIMNSQSSCIEDISRIFGLRQVDIKALSLELFTFLESDGYETKLTAIRRMFNHSEYSYISTLKLNLK